MKRKSLIMFALLYTTACYAQSTNQRTMKGKVVFERDSTDLVAMVYQKDTVNVLFKMMFDKPVASPLPANGQYAISYSDRQIQFDAPKGSKSYAFSIDDLEASVSNRNVSRKLINGLSRMNPSCFPRKAKDQ